MGEQYNWVHHEMCTEKTKRFDEKIDTHDIRLNNHSLRLDLIERETTELDSRLDNLIDQLKDLTSWVKWLIITIFASLLGFFFFMIKTLVV